MRVYEITQEGAVARIASKLVPQQLELPFTQTAKTVAKPSRIEYWGYLPGETAQSRRMWTKQFNSEEEAQAWMNQRNATPMGSKPIP